jgi:hypothetical protein
MEHKKCSKPPTGSESSQLLGKKSKMFEPTNQFWIFFIANRHSPATSPATPEVYLLQGLGPFTCGLLQGLVGLLGHTSGLVFLGEPSRVSPWVMTVMAPQIFQKSWRTIVTINHH